MIAFCKYFISSSFFFATSPCVALFEGLKGITDDEVDHSGALAFCKTLMGPTHCAEVALIFSLLEPLSPSPTALSPLIFALHPLRSPLQPPRPAPLHPRLSSRLPFISPSSSSFASPHSLLFNPPPPRPTTTTSPHTLLD